MKITHQRLHNSKCAACQKKTLNGTLLASPIIASCFRRLIFLALSRDSGCPDVISGSFVELFYLGFLGDLQAVQISYPYLFIHLNSYIHIYTHTYTLYTYVYTFMYTCIYIYMRPQQRRRLVANDAPPAQSLCSFVPATQLDKERYQIHRFAAIITLLWRHRF